MKIKSIMSLLMLCLVIIFSSCTTNSLSDPSDFSVQLDTLKTYKVGDTLRFTISGGFADQIVFFSGEIGKQYSKTNRTVEAGIPKLLFQSSMGQGDPTDRSSLRLMISSNLKGYDSIHVANATWTDITTRNTKWPIAIGSSFTTSDSIDLSDYNAISDSITLAFKYIGLNTPAVQPDWKISNLTLTNFLTDGTKSPIFSTFDNTGWVEVSMKGKLKQAWNVGTWNFLSAAKTSSMNSDSVAIRSAYPVEMNPGSDKNNPDNEDWLISRAVNLKTTIADVGTCIKNSADLTLCKYNYRYSKAGTYVVSFIAMNINNTNKKKVLKQFVVKINE